MASKKQVVSLDGKKLTLSNLDKILYPEAMIAKAELIQYYLTISPFLLDFAKDRPITMIRYPDGISKEKFYTKNLPDFAPDFIKSKVYSDDEIAYPLLDSKSALVWMANLASLELHADNIRFKSKDVLLDHIILDLDPPETFTYENLKVLSLEIMEYLVTLGMSPKIKTSGSKGVHIYVAIEKIPYSDAFFGKLQKLAENIVERFPKQSTLQFRKNKRGGKVFIDILRNRFIQTCVLPFSTRAIAGAPVSLPLHLEDFKATTSSREFTIKTAAAYILEKGNPWKDFEKDACSFFGSGPKIKKHIALPDLGAEWFNIPSFKHQLASEIKVLNRNSDKEVYENKWDGIRVYIYVNGSKVKILSRNNRDITTQFKDVAKVFEGKSKEQYVFDAEIVSTDKKGRPIFAQVVSRLHQKQSSKPKFPAAAYVFDTIVSKGKICVSLAWEKRRALLEEAKFEFPKMLLSEIYTDGKLLLQAVTNMGMEGIMIKDKDAAYHLGDRTNAWRKLKIRHEVECLIVGYTAGSGDRSPYFGSLHVGEEKDGEFIYRGKVGTGWTHDELASLFKEINLLETTEILPFKNIKDIAESTWIAEPYKKCKIKYASLTSSKTFREPVFICLVNE